MMSCPKGYKGACFMPNTGPLPTRTAEGLASRLSRLIHGTWEEASAYGAIILLGSPVTSYQMLWGAFG